MLTAYKSRCYHSGENNHVGRYSYDERGIVDNNADLYVEKEYAYVK